MSKCPVSRFDDEKYQPKRASTFNVSTSRWNTPGHRGDGGYQRETERKNVLIFSSEPSAHWQKRVFVLFSFFFFSVFPPLSGVFLLSISTTIRCQTSEHRANQIDMSITTYRATRNSRDVIRSKEETRNLPSLVLFHPLELPCQKGNRPKRRHPRWSIETTRLTHRVHSLAHYWLGETSPLETGTHGLRMTKIEYASTDTRHGYAPLSYPDTGKNQDPPPPPPSHWRNNRGAWQRGAGEPPAESLPRKQRGQGRPLLNDDKYAVSSEVRCTRSTGALSWRLSRCRHGQRDLGCSLATPTRGSPNQHQLNRFALPRSCPPLPRRS